MAKQDGSAVAGLKVARFPIRMRFVDVERKRRGGISAPSRPSAFVLGAVGVVAGVFLHSRFGPPSSTARASASANGLRIRF
jgi:hypothetical protein